MTYLDFELEIGPGRGREYPVAVTHSPAGEARATMRFPYDEFALEKRLVVLQNGLLGSGGAVRQIPSPEELVVRDFGRDLFEALFTGQVRRCYEHSREQVWGEDTGIRLKLHIQPSPLAALPWEFLYDPRQAEYVCLSRNTQLVRYLEPTETTPPLSLSPPLHILAMISGPGGLEHSELAREKEQVETALDGLQARGLAQLTWLEGQSWHHLQEAMQRGTWHIFHFLSTRGSSRQDLGADRPDDKGFTAPASEKGETRPLSAADLTRLLANHRDLRLALLNTCDRDDGASLRNVFTSTAARLVRQGMPAVLAMPYQITDEAAIELFRAFYEALALGMPVDAAVTEAREAVRSAVANTVEWGAPALFTGSLGELVTDPGEGIHSVQAQVIEKLPQVPVQLETPAEAPEPKPAPAAPRREPRQPRRQPRPDRRIPLRTRPPIIQPTPEAEKARPQPRPEPEAPVRTSPPTEPTPTAPPRKVEEKRPQPRPEPAVPPLEAEERRPQTRLEPEAPVRTPPPTEPAPAAPPREAEEKRPQPRPEPEILVRTPLPIEPELILIPAGEFLMGSDPEKDPDAYEAEQPQHRVHLPDYQIARTPITNAQYAAFVEASGYEAPNRWEDGKLPEGKEDYPVAYISWFDAMAYCKWLSEKNAQAYRLPSEAEWEKAARGTEGRIYPWGDAWDSDRCNSKESGPDEGMLVDAYPDGASPYGVLDMAGNVWEWTGSLYRPYPYHPKDGREEPGAFGKRVLRSGAFYSTARRVRCAYRDSGYPDDWRGSYGFRVVLASG